MRSCIIPDGCPINARTPGGLRVHAKLGDRRQDSTPERFVELAQLTKRRSAPLNLEAHRSGDAVFGQHLTMRDRPTDDSDVE